MFNSEPYLFDLHSFDFQKTVFAHPQCRPPAKKTVQIFPAPCCMWVLQTASVVMTKGYRSLNKMEVQPTIHLAEQFFTCTNNSSQASQRIMFLQHYSYSTH